METRYRECVNCSNLGYDRLCYECHLTLVPRNYNGEIPVKLATTEIECELWRQSLAEFDLILEDIMLRFEGSDIGVPSKLEIIGQYLSERNKHRKR